MDLIYYLPLISVFLPFAISPVTYILGRSRSKTSGVVSTLTVLITLLAVLTLSMSGDFVVDNVLNFTVNRLTVFISFIPAFLGFLAMLYSIGYLKDHAASYYTLSLIFLGSMLGMSLSWNLAWMYIFMEITTISSAILVAHRRDAISYEAAIKYILICIAASTITIIGIATFYSATGSLNLQAPLMETSSWAIKVMAISFLVGIGVKMAIFPLHSWLPDAHSEAPAPISTLLSGAMIGIGSYATFIVLFKTAYAFLAPSLSSFILIFGSLSMVIGAVMALAQRDLKRLLAYSSVSQMGYIIVAIGLGTPLGVIAGLFHIINHAFAKGLLFFGAGSIEKATGVRDLDQLGGLAKHMPVTAASMFVASLAIAGVPPLNGFASKWMIFAASLEAGQPLVAVIGMAVSAFTFIYLMKVMHSAFFGLRNNPDVEVKEPLYTMRIPMIILAGLCIFFGILPQLVIESWLLPASQLFVATPITLTLFPLTTSIGLWNSLWATLLLLLGVVVGFAVYMLGYRSSPKPKAVDNKLLPFTGGMAYEPYLNLQDLKVNSTPFTFAATKVISFARRLHPGLLNVNLLWVTVFLVILIIFLMVV
ncbi:MAG: proton-conducting transporter membrane subunit [Nitrososphaerales archaeon]